MLFYLERKPSSRSCMSASAELLVYSRGSTPEKFTHPVSVSVLIIVISVPL